MAQNVVIDIDARTKNFENALDSLTAKVRSTVDQMDKAFSLSGNAEKSIKNTSNAVGELHNGLKNIGFIAAGNMLADGFENAIKKVKQLGNEIYGTTARMQSLEMGMKSLVTSDLVKTGQVKDYTEATAQAEIKTKELMDWFKELSLKSPYELMEVMESFKQNANMGQSVEIAKKTTEAILALGAGLGMGQAEMKRFSAALAQTGATGRITAMDLRQFANNGFGMDKMNQIFSILSEKYQVVIKDNNDFNKAVAEGIITTDDFFTALNTFALDNYGNAVDAMASTIEGLKSSLGDIKTSAINDLFLEASKTVSKTLAPYVEYLMQMLTGGDFSKWGDSINKWAQGILKPLQKIGETLENGVLTRALNSLKEFFSGNSLNLGAVKVFLNDIGGAEFADKWIAKIQKIKEYIDKFIDHKDVIISAIKGIGIAFTTAFAVNKISGFIGLLGKMNNPITKLSLLGAAFGVAWSKNLFQIQEKSQGFLEYIKSLIEVFQKDGANGGIKGVFEKIKTDANNVFDDVKNSVTQKWTEIQNAFQTDGLKGVFDLLIAEIQPSLQKIWDGLPEGFKEKIETIKNDVNNFTEPIKNAFQNAFSYIGDLKDLFNAEGLGAVISKVFTDAATGIKEKLKNIIPENVIETLEKIWGWIEKITQGLAGFALGVGALAAIDALLKFAAVIADIVAGAQTFITIMGMLASAIDWPVVALAALISVGFAVIGQFIDFKQLISNIFNTIKNTVMNVVNGIIENVAPRFQGLLETLQPILEIGKAIGIVLAGVGTAIAGVIVAIGVLAAGAINGIIKAIDDIIAVIIDVVDFIISLIRLPFDIIVNLGKFIIGVIKGDTGMMEEAVSAVVERLKHIWQSFKNIFIDLWSGIKDFFIGVWEVIESTINSIDISAGLERLFGKEVAQKFEEIRDKVLGFIDEIKNAWQHMLGLLNGDIVVLGNGKEISSKTDDAFRIYQNKKFGEDDFYYNAIRSGMGLDEFAKTYFTDWETQLTDYNAAKATWDIYSEESLFDEFTQGILTDIESYLEQKDPIGKQSAETRRKWADDYVSQKYKFVSDDSYMQSLINGLYERLGLNTAAVESNTQSTDTNTKAEEKSTSGTGKVESSSPTAEKEADAIINFTKQQADLLSGIVASLKDDIFNEGKSFDTFAIDELKNIITSSENKSADTIRMLSDTWLSTVGMSNENYQGVMNLLSSTEDTSVILNMLETIVSVLEEGNIDILSGMKEQQKEYVKTVDDILNESFNTPKSSVKDNPEYTWTKPKDIEIEIDPEAQKKLDESMKLLEDQNKLLDEQKAENKKAIEKLGLLEKIEDLNKDDTSEQEIQEAKDALLQAATEFGATQDTIDKLQKQIESNELEKEDLLLMLTQLVNGASGQVLAVALPNQVSNATDAYYQMEVTLRDYISNKLPEAINELKKALNDGALENKNRLNFEMKEIQRYLEYSSSYSVEQLQEVITSSLQRSGLPKEIQDAYISAITTDGIDKDFITSYITMLIKAVEDAGLVAATGKESKQPLYQFNEKWLENTQRLLNNKDIYRMDDSHYADLLISAIGRSGLPQDIQDSMTQALSTTGVTKDFVAEYVGYMITAIQENGIGTNGEYTLPSYKENWDAGFQAAWQTVYDDFLSGHNYEITSSIQGMTEEEANEWMSKNGYTEQQYYDSLSQYHNLMDTLGPALKDTMNAVGLNSDTFQHVSIDNFAEAKEYIGSFEQFGELYNDVMSGSITNQDLIAARMEDIVGNMANDETAELLSNILKANTDPTWTKLFMQLLHGEVGNLTEGLKDALNNINTQVGNMGSAASSHGKNNADVDTVKELYQNYNNASGDLKTYYQDMIQGYIESTLNGTGSTWAGISVDMMNKDINLWNDWIRDLSMYGTSNAKGWTVADRQMYNWGTHLQQAKDYEEQMLASQKEMEELKELDPEKYAEMMKENKNQGLFGMLFGEDFDLSELFAQGLEGLSDFLNEDTIASIQSLFNIELDAEKASSWHKMATALSVLGTAMESLKTAVGGEDGFLQNLTTDLKDLTDIEIAEDTINNLKEFSNALNNLGTALQSIASALGNNASGALEGAITSGIDPNTMVSDSGGLLDSLKEIANMQFDENAIANWNLFSDALNGVANGLMGINSYIGLLDMSQFAEFQAPEALTNTWSQLASDTKMVADNLQLIQPILTSLFGTGKEGEGEQPGLLSGMQTEGESAGNGILGMLFGSMDSETITALSEMLTPELLTAFMTLLTTQIDTQVVDSWTLLGDQIVRTSQAIIGMMTALTGGEDGELGDESAGSAFVTALYNIGAAAEVVGPQLKTSLNPYLLAMKEYLEIILTNLTKICDVMITTFPQAVKAFVPNAELAIDATMALAEAAASAASKYADLAGQIWNAVNGLKALIALLEDMPGGVPGGINIGGGNAGGGNPEIAAAGGTSGFRYGTAIVGEHGPELITNNGSRAWTVFSNNTLMDEIARTKYALNVLSNSAEYFAYNRLAGGSSENTGTTDNSQNFTNNFNGNIVGDAAFREMVEDTVREVWRREMNLAN